MAYTEKLGSIGDLMAMWQNRANREQQSQMQREQEKKRQSEMQQQALMQQLAKENVLLTPQNIKKFQSGFGQLGEDYMVVPGGFPGNIEGAANKQPLSQTVGYISGTPGEEVFKQKMETGRAMLGAMSRGGGGGGGGGGEKGNGGANFEVSDGKGGVMVGSNLGSGQGYGYAGPDKSNKPNVVEAAGALGQIANQGQAPIEPTMADLLAQEQQNNAGYKSIINQKYANPSVETINRLMPNDNPVQAAIDKAASDKDLNFKAALAGGTKTGLSPQEIINLDIIKSKSENDQKVATQSEAIKKQREGEVRRLNLEQLKMNPAAMQIFSGPAAVEPEIQQAILDIGSSEQKKLFQYLPKMDSATKNKVLSTLPIAVAQNRAVNKRLDVDAFLKLLKISVK